MTVVLLTSVSLVALLVASRPILHPDADLVVASSALQTGIQTPFQIHPGRDDRFHFQGLEQEIGHLDEDVAAIASFHVSDEPPLTETVFSNTVETDTNDVADNVVALEPDLTSESPSAPLVVLVFSCMAAFLALVSVALMLYVIKSLRSQMLASKTAWELLPRFWRCPRSEENSIATTKQHLSGGGRSSLQSERLVDAEEGSAQRNDSRLGVYFDAVSDVESEWDDVDEKYQDALDVTPLAPIHDLPLEDNVSRPSHVVDPLSPPVASHPLDRQTDGDRSALAMRDVCPSPVSRPAWSVRAIDSPALGLSSRHGGIDATPEPLVQPHRRAYRSPVPEFDIALAMQLRPGLGIGADSAWMVRFLMAMFGWFAVALTGNAR